MLHPNSPTKEIFNGSDRNTEENITENELTEWVNSLVTHIKPNGDLRVCLNLRDLNKALKREQGSSHTFEGLKTIYSSRCLFRVLAT